MGWLGVVFSPLEISHGAGPQAGLERRKVERTESLFQWHWDVVHCSA